MPTKSVVVGKFYPFHKGHGYLVQTALDHSDHVTVLVCDNPAYTIPAAIRASWIRELYPDAEVRVIPDLLGEDDNSRKWAAYTIELLGYVPDLVCTSEDYGAAYARFMGCRHIMVDRHRVHVPVSGTRIRSDPWKYSEFLDPVVRAYFVKRIAVVGAESTGTTTTARALAQRYRTSWVPEYGRFYCDGKFVSRYAGWYTQEFSHIAAMQAAAEDQMARVAHRVLFCDTDPLATTIWHLHYMKCASAEVENIARGRQYALYLITDTDIPLEQDGTRDGIEEARQIMHNRFIEAVSATGTPYTVLSGSLEVRLAQAVRLVDTL